MPSLTYICMLCPFVYPVPVRVVKHPQDVFMERAPEVSKKVQIELRCQVVAWPPPTYQWFRDGEPVPGAGGPTLVLDIEFPDDQGRQKLFRCTKCARATRALNEFVVHVECGHCGKVEDLGRYDRNTRKLQCLESEERVLRDRLRALEQLQVQNPSCQSMLTLGVSQIAQR